MAELGVLLQHFDKQQLQLWSLIEAQREFRTTFSQSVPLAFNQDTLDLMDGIVDLLQECETEIWRIVPIQLKTRLKLSEFVEFAEHNDRSADEASGVDVDDVGDDEDVEYVIEESFDDELNDEDELTLDEGYFAIETENIGEDDEETKYSEQLSEMTTRSEGEEAPSSDSDEGIFNYAILTTIDELIGHWQLHPKRKCCLMCTTCSAKMTTKAMLKQHCQLHSDENAFECDLCARAFIVQGQANDQPEVEGADNAVSIEKNDEPPKPMLRSASRMVAKPKPKPKTEQNQFRLLNLSIVLQPIDVPVDRSNGRGTSQSSPCPTNPSVRLRKRAYSCYETKWTRCRGDMATKRLRSNQRRKSVRRA